MTKNAKRECAFAWPGSGPNDAARTRPSFHHASAENLKPMSPQIDDDHVGFFLTVDALKTCGVEVPLPIAEIIWQSARAFQSNAPELRQWREQIKQTARRMTRE